MRLTKTFDQLAEAPTRFEPSSSTSRNCRVWSWIHSPFGVIRKREYDPSEQIAITVLFASELGPNAQTLMVFSGKWNLQELHWELKYFGRKETALKKMKNCNSISMLLTQT